jgi:hypothetical protein
MDINELAEVLMYSSSDSIYVVTLDNVLNQIFTPFKTIVLSDVGQLSKGEIVWVEQVRVTIQLKTVFIVNTKAYYHYHFSLIIE